MLAMENSNSNSNPVTSSRHGRASSVPHSSFKHRRSGYEPSDTESEWHDSPWHDFKSKKGQGNDSEMTEKEDNRSPSPSNRIQRYPSSYSKLSPTRTSSIAGRNSKSPYRTRREESNVERFKTNGVSQRNTSPFERTRQQISPFKARKDDPDHLKSSNRRNNSISPYKPRKEEVGIENNESNRRNTSVSPYKSRKEEAKVEIYRSNRKNTDVSPYKSKKEEMGLANSESNRRNGSISPYKSRKEEMGLENSESNRRNNSISPYQSRKEGMGLENYESNRRNNSISQYKPRKEEDDDDSKTPNLRNTSPFSRDRRDLMNSKENRSNSNISVASAQRASSLGMEERRGAQSPTPIEARGISSKVPSATDINETITNAKLSNGGVLASDSESIVGDIFFSVNYPMPNSNFVTANDRIPPKAVVMQQRNRGIVTQTASQTSSGSVSSRQTSKTSTGTEYSKTSEASGGISRSESLRKFTAERQKSHSDSQWFACVRRGSCRSSKSPEKEIDEASFIEKAFVLEDLRPFWADKHGPSSLDGFICHKQQAQHLKQLISRNNCPHILFKGPSGAGKKALSMALLRELHGAAAWKISHDIRCFNIRETRPTQVILPVTSSPHHVEINLKAEPKNARHVLMALIREIIGNPLPTPEFSEANFKPDYKVIVLYEVDKLEENVQHLIKWIMDCYVDACKLILCCEDDTHLPESIKSRCEVISLNAPVTHEIIEVLIQIARKENFDLSVNFAAKIAAKSKQNLRKAIMALEACKAHNYPFVNEQPIPLGWEEVLIELAAEILADPSPKRLFFTRGKFQKLLLDFVHPKLILQKLVEQFLKGIDAGLKRELYYWHAYYHKRLPAGSSALLKLEEFVAKFMSIYRKSSVGCRYNAQ